MIYIGSARLDEKGNIKGGKLGDQKQKSKPDYAGEVSMQAMYAHKLGWYILRPKSIQHANAISSAMITACNNPHLGYDQNNRLGVIQNGIDTSLDTACDCSALVRACVIKATGCDAGNFNTATEKSTLMKTGLFYDMGEYVNQTKTPIFAGDILVTRTKGHTVVVCSGNERKAEKEAKKAVKMTVKTKGSNLNVREGASTAFHIITSLKNGTVVEVTEKRNGWYYIPKYKGWASGTYLK